LLNFPTPQSLYNSLLAEHVPRGKGIKGNNPKGIEWQGRDQLNLSLY
jgi:hypothetical protein